MLTQDVQYITQDEQLPCEKHIKGNYVKGNLKKRLLHVYLHLWSIITTPRQKPAWLDVDGKCKKGTY